MLVLLVGVPAAGKTTLGKELRSQVDKLAYYPSGETKKYLLKELGIYKHLSELNQIESTLINALYFDRFPTVSVRVELVDTHASYGLSDGTFVNLLTSNINAEAVILLEADAHSIANRRVKRGRSRDSIDISIIKRELLIERSYAKMFCEQKDVPLLVVDNTGGKWEYDEVKTFIKELMPVP